MILSIPSLINGYEITECTRSDGAGLCETYKGKSKLQKPVIIVAYNMKAIERSSFKAAYFWKLSCHQPLFSPSFQPLFDKISIKNKGRNIKIIVFQALPSMMTLDEKQKNGNIKEEDAWNIIMDIVIGIRECAYKHKDISQLALDSNNIYVYQDKRGKLRGIMPNPQTGGFPINSSSDKSQQYSLALLATKILKGSTLNLLQLDDTAASQNNTNKQKLGNCSQGNLAHCIRKALASNPNKRYSSVEDFIKELTRFSPFQMPNTFECFGKP